MWDNLNWDKDQYKIMKSDKDLFKIMKDYHKDSQILFNLLLKDNKAPSSSLMFIILRKSESLYLF